MNSDKHSRRRRFTTMGSVRVRTTTGAVFVVGVALVIAAAVMLVILRRSLTDNVRATALQRADAVASFISSGASGDPTRARDDDEFVQVLDDRGRVVLASSNAEDRPIVDDLIPGESREIDVPFEDDPFLAVATEDRQGSHSIVVGRTLDEVLESTEVVGTLLLVGAPLLLLFVAAVTWSVVGRALAPVESMRTEVDAISTDELYRRVPGPGGSDEVARLATTMNKMLDRLEAGQARQRRFVSDASHELRSPVSTIRQHAEVALEHPNESSTEDLAAVVLSEDLRLQRLVEDLLLLARMDEHVVDARKALLDLDDVVLEEVARHRDSKDRTIDITKVSAGRVLGDRKQLAKLTGNLLENAFRHARRNVAVALAQENDRVVLRVDDDGTGLPPEERARIFERFVRLQQARDRDSGGSGLGLAIVGEVAAAHGGTAVALDSPLGGARFEVSLPGAPADAEIQPGLRQAGRT
jgi:signal transduction histidine kinase